MRRFPGWLRVLGLLVVVTAAASAVAAAEDKAPPELRFAKILADNMVLQQEKPIRVWGWAKPAAKVTVTLTQDPATGEKALAEAAELAAKRNVSRPPLPLSRTPSCPLCAAGGRTGATAPTGVSRTKIRSIPYQSPLDLEPSTGGRIG